jgi:signal transduction histidine kinase/DNA-binding response OmpR family regulator
VAGRVEADLDAVFVQPAHAGGRMTDAVVRVLLVADDPADARFTRDLLSAADRSGFEIEIVDRLAEAGTVLARRSTDVALFESAICDPDWIREVGDTCAIAPDVPFLVLTGSSDESTAVEVIRAGAQDCLEKSRLTGELLTRAIRSGIERKRREISRHRLPRDVESEHERLRFLVDAGMLLAASLDFEETLESVASLAVRSIADFCIIDVVDTDGETRRLSVAHADAGKADLAARLRAFPIDRGRAHLSAIALDSAEPRVVDVTPELLRSVAQDEEHLRTLEELGPVSYIAVPLRARDRSLGALVMISSNRSYTAEDLQLAQELGRRAALAVDDARLYREAHRVIRARDEVLRIVSHDLRNPLSTITMSADILLDAQVNFSEEQKIRQLHVILRSAERMNRLIGDLLDVARVEAGQLAIDPMYYDPRRLVREAVELHTALATARSLQLRGEADEVLPPVLADRDRILQVLANLIGNAIKFTPEGGDLVVRAQAAGDRVRFSVTDTGPGIPEQQLSQLFRPFWQGRRGGRDGAGLGLAVAKGIVEAHGGEIGVESTVGVGTTVFFTLVAVEDRRDR